MPDPSLSPKFRRVGPAVFHDFSVEELAAYLVSQGGRGHSVFYLNAHGLNMVFKDPQFARDLGRADVCFCDGFGVLLLARLFGGQRVAHRITGPDFLDYLYERIAEAKLTVYFLGDTPEVISAYAARVKGKLGDLLVGYHHGYIADDPAVSEEVLRELDRLRPQILFVGMGMPRQEHWIVAHRERLGATTCMTVGAAFAWGTDAARRRGPRWATDRGLEWFFRLLYEPRLVWRRYLVGLPEVFFRLAIWHLRRGRRQE